MAGIDRDAMGSSMIRVSNEVHDMLNEAKIIPQEPYNDCLKRIFDENRRFKKMYFTTQTKEKMEKDIKNFVLNAEVPDSHNDHREIWKNAHPEELLNQDDIIHHINGNYNDNRPENLMKVTAKQHGAEHAKLNEELKKGDLII